MIPFSLHTLPDPLQKIHRTLLHSAPQAVLVGGAVRDALLNAPVHDLDYVLPRGGMSSARRLADALGGAYYALDVERDVGRVVWSESAGSPWVVDVAAWQAPTLLADLQGRDFTVNAMALLPDGRLYDPLHGQQDLQQGCLRPCSAHSLADDPVRSLRAVRFLLQLDYHPAPDLAALVMAVAPRLHEISAERRRDEWLKILKLPAPERAFAWLHAWGLLPHILPDMLPLQGLTQPAIHAYDAYRHTVAVLQWMAVIDETLRRGQVPTNALAARVYATLAPYQPTLAAYLRTELVQDRPRWLWLRFAALAHDWGKPQTLTQDTQGRIHFFGHETISAQRAEQWLYDYHAAKAERLFVRTVCGQHMRPVHLLADERTPSRRAIFRLLRDAGDAALGIILLHIADHCATIGPDLSPADLAEYLQRVMLLAAPLLDAPPHTAIPQPLLTGKTIMQQFALAPGPLIGDLLADLQEAQAVGEVETPEQANAWVQDQLAIRDL